MQVRLEGRAAHDRDLAGRRRRARACWCSASSCPVGFAAVALAAAAMIALISRAARVVQGVAADVRRRAHRGADGLAHRARQPPQADDGPAPRAAGRERRSRRACSCCSTSTASSATTTPTATPPATCCSRASAATSAARSSPTATAYRIGGDEFCVLVMTGASSAKTIIALAASALSEQGEGFAIKASHGAVMLPHEARDATLALQIADQRMYAHKEDRRSSATRQTRDILLQVLHEREPDLGNHLKGVAKLAHGRRHAPVADPRGARRGRARRRAARRRQDGDPRRDPAQARPAQRGGVGLRPPAHDHRRAHPERGAGAAAGRQARARRATSTGTAPATRTASPARRSRSARASSRSATRSTR